LGECKETLGNHNTESVCGAQIQTIEHIHVQTHVALASALLVVLHGCRLYHCLAKPPPGDVLRLLLDSDAGTLTVKKNGTLLRVAVTSGLTGDLCWAVAAGSSTGDSVRIKAVDLAEF
jgi:hypothetical protein